MLNIINMEFIKLRRDSYDKLKFKADFVDSDYVATDFLGHKMYLKDEAIKELEDFYKIQVEEYKKKVRKKFSLRFWKWRIKFTRK